MSRAGVALSAAAYTVPTDRPEADGTFAWDSTTLVVVEARAEGGLGTGWTYAPAAAVAVVDELLGPALSSADPHDVEGSWEAMVRAVRNAGRLGLVGMAVSAADISLWDLRGRLEDRSLAELWAAEPHDVALYGSGGFTTYDDETTRRQLAGWAEEGMRAVKIKIGESWGSCVDRDLHRVAVARDAVGEDVDVFVDANGGYDRVRAAEVGRRLDGLGVPWFEEPVSSDDHVGLATLHHGLELDVAAGEYGYDRAYFRHLAPVVDCLQVDVTRCGGYTEWRRIVADAAAAGLDVSAHCAPYATLPAAATTPNLRHQEWFHDHVRIEQALLDGWQEPVDGVLRPSTGAGHGLTLRREAAEPLRVA